ncbi:kinase-like protein [Auriculariales sp. MPI-PUGE-AT-0066]|nr:kinase-like protein [Auriculariales sp. MPI-PUGE-AT-0066]
MPPVPTSSGEDDLSPYVISKEIGKGSFATVYKGYHQENKLVVAVKTVSRHVLTPKLLDNLQTEIHILKSCNHKHITRLVEIIERPKHIHLVMEFCAGGDLSGYIKRRGRVEGLEYSPGPNLPVQYYPHPRIGGLDEIVVRSFLRQLARALKFLRHEKLIHRDLKPQNLLLSPQSDRDLEKGTHPIGVPILKVADFGFARVLPGAMMAETLCGSPLYMAPEILRYEKYDAKADLWSVGAVLYEICVGKPPFRAQNHVELLKRIEHARSNVKFPDEDPSSPTTDPATGNPIKPVPADIKALIRSLLKRQPVERASYDDFFASPAIANSKTRHGKTGRTTTSRAESITSSAVPTQPPTPTPTGTRATQQPRRNGTAPASPTEPSAAVKGKATAADERPATANAAIVKPTTAATVSAWNPLIPERHKYIPREVLDEKAMFPPSPFDFRGRTQKNHTDLGADVSADHVETPGTSPTPNGLLQRMAPGSSPLRPTLAPRKSPRTRVSPRLAPHALPEQDRVKQLSNDTDARLVNSMGETTKDYVIVDARAVGFNQALDDITTRQTSPPLMSPDGKSPTFAFPPDSSRRTSTNSLPVDDGPPIFPPPGQYGSAQVHTYNPTRIATHALTKALNIASKTLFGTGNSGSPVGNGGGFGGNQGSPGTSADDNTQPLSPTGLGLRIGSSPVMARKPSLRGHAPDIVPPSPITESIPEDPREEATEEAENALFATLEDLAQKTYVLNKWADKMLADLKVAREAPPSTRVTETPRRRPSSNANPMQDAPAAIAVYMTLMKFSQRALDQLRTYHESIPLGQQAGPGFEAALKWFKSSFLNSHEKAGVIQSWLSPEEQVSSLQWADQLIYRHALDLSREAAQKELFDKATSPNECEKLYEESLWCLYALRDDLLEDGKAFMDEDRKTISMWITRTKLRLVRCRMRMGLDAAARLQDARADANLDEVVRQPAPWDIAVTGGQ